MNLILTAPHTSLPSQRKRNQKLSPLCIKARKRENDYLYRGSLPPPQQVHTLT